MAEYGQNLFDRYIAYADAWIEDQDFKGCRHRPIAGTGGCARQRAFSRSRRPPALANPKDFRQRGREVCAALSAISTNGRNPAWTAYEKIRSVIEKRMFTQVEDLLPVISFEAKKYSVYADQAQRVRQAHAHARLHPPRQVRRLVEWYMRVNKAG